ncbi:MAG: c-type cytochrome [Akkermansiaceae bacterium]|jgi:glucose/arabinose dehydrogenase|nr:c-type cytochrome [Luteolibacter sp.]
MSFTKWMLVPVLGAGWVGAAEIDAVAAGKKIFETVGCSECHTVTKGDTSFKTGPNLFGLLLTTPRDRKVTIAGKETIVKADRAYFERSLRKSWDELAIAEVGPASGTAYGAIMPHYVKELVSDEDMESVYHYLRTLAEGAEQGPANVMVKRQAAKEPTSILQIPNEEIITDRTVVFRASLRGTSGRALHVGQPNGMNYTFDPRMLSVRRIWSGGFLNMKEERTSRGSDLPKMGKGAKVHYEGIALLQPLTSKGEAVDFEFKEPDAHDNAAIEKHLWDKVDFADRLAALDAEFLGHREATGTSNPSFQFRVGKNVFDQTVTLSEKGALAITLSGATKEAQTFTIAAAQLSDLKVIGGKLENDKWTIPAGEKGPFTIQAQLKVEPAIREAVSKKENWAPQKLVTKPSVPGKAPIELPAGYSLEDWVSPLDLLGREQLFEPTGIAVAKDGTIVFGTRAAGIWRIRNGEWTLFAQGTYEVLGVHIEDDKGDVIVIAQKPEITRISDSNADGRADTFVTLSDDYGFHGNYHEYCHGLARDPEGNYYFLLNLSHDHGADRASWRAGGNFMGSMGGYRGWAMRVTPKGKTETFAYGLRSPAGIGTAPDGRIWYAENQGEYCGSSKIVPLEKDKFYGHMSGLESLPGMIPDAPELNHDLWKDKLRKGAVWLPHAMMANSPGHLTWDLTGGKFGGYQKQMFVGDQTLSQLLRVVTEVVDGQDQGCVIPFGKGLASGIMRPAFLPDGSLLLGQTGRGWTAKGGKQSALQRVIYDGKTVAADISTISTTPTGYDIHFTQPIGANVTPDQLKAALVVKSWFYTNLVQYGSPRHDQRDEVITNVTLSADRKSLLVDFDGFGNGDKWTGRLYHLQFKDAAPLFDNLPVWKMLEGFHTLNAIPKAK